MNSQNGRGTEEQALKECVSILKRSLKYLN